MQEETRYSDSDRTLRNLIAAAIKRSPKKRLQIAEELTAFLGIRVTEHMLNDFTSDNKKSVRFPLLFTAALCDILEDDSIALFALRPGIRAKLEFAELQLKGCRTQRELDSLREQLLDEMVERAKGGSR
jgi:hypothetical protein